ncbi:MAG: aminotransferase class I/II-fold pyridoxal phosphate-dependent enzyme [Nanoarchaeota archaeon]
MSKERFHESLQAELARIDSLSTAKRQEKVIDAFDFKEGHAPHAIIKGKEYLIFNSNDYLGLRFSPRLHDAEEQASRRFGAGPGAVRFISGTLKVHKQLEDAIAKFHKREAAMVFSSAFAANLAVIHCLIKGQSKDSAISPNTLVISDELNHRSIIDGIRVAGLEKASKAIFKHLDLNDLRRVLEENKGKFKRCLIITDGVFSMLGEHQDLGKLQAVTRDFDNDYEEGIITLVDDAHGVAAYGSNGRGTEEMTRGGCDLLVATFGKGFGADGGYVAGDQLLIDYLRESAASYIYSNSIAPGTAGASLESVKLVDSAEGKGLIRQLHDNILLFKKGMQNMGFSFAADSKHAIQPVLIGDPAKTKALVDSLFAKGVLVTNISYPVVPKGRDEIRVQLSAAQTKADIHEFLSRFEAAAKGT